MEALYVVIHQRKPNVDVLTRQLVAAMQAAGLHAYAEPWLWKQMGEESPSLFREGGPEQCEAVLSVGGDGTFLRGNAVATKHCLPILGINIGTVGFLAEMEWEQLNAACRMLRENQFDIHERMMLQAELEGRTWLALNDVVLSRGGYARLVGLSVSVNGEEVGPYIADGLIAATPTGSTGYSLSAGGPIVYPEVECIVLTPICAHSLQHRPVIAAPTQRVELRLAHGHTQEVHGTVDGQDAFFLEDGQRLLITRAAQKARFIDMNARGFFSTIRIKLTEWSR